MHTYVPLVRSPKSGVPNTCLWGKAKRNTAWWWEMRNIVLGCAGRPFLLGLWQPRCAGKKSSWMFGKNAVRGGRPESTERRQSQGNCYLWVTRALGSFSIRAVCFLFWIQNFKVSFVSQWQLWCLPPVLVWEETAFINVVWSGYTLKAGPSMTS